MQNIYEDEIGSRYSNCRAFKKLEEIIDISREKIKKPIKLIILKGKNAQKKLINFH